MSQNKHTAESSACARLLDGAADELATIRAALTSVSLEAANEKRAAGRIPAAHPLRTKPVKQAPPPIPATPLPPDMPAGAPGHTAHRQTLAERLRSARR